MIIDALYDLSVALADPAAQINEVLDDWRSLARDSFACPDAESSDAEADWDITTQANSTAAINLRSGSQTMLH